MGIYYRGWVYLFLRLPCGQHLPCSLSPCDVFRRWQSGSKLLRLFPGWKYLTIFCNFLISSSFRLILDKERKQFFVFLTNTNSKIPKYLLLFSIKWIFLKSRWYAPSVFTCLVKAFCELSIKAAKHFQIECVLKLQICVGFFRNVRSISKIRKMLYLSLHFPKLV